MSGVRRASKPSQPAERGLLCHVFERWLRNYRDLRKGYRVWWRYKLPSAIWRVACGWWLFSKIALTRHEASVEISAMRYVRAHTQIPVPFVWGFFRLPWTRGDQCYIVMNRVSGVDLESIWEQLDESARDHVVDQLAPFMDDMRRLSSPHGSAVCAVNGEAVVDHRLPDKLRGPYTDEAAFNHILRYFEPLESLPDEISTAHLRPHPIVLTHGDIMPRNIMVDPTTLTITALIDWGSAGWFPSWWEYRKACWTAYSQLEKQSWVPRLSRFMPTFVAEVEVDDYLVRQFPP